MELRFLTEEKIEGKAKVLVPKLEDVKPGLKDQARSRAAVFYNPIMRLNRDTAVLILCVLREEFKIPLKTCEPMCGSGIRGIRLAIEAGVGSVTLGDLNPSAIQLAEENIARNHVGNFVQARVMDANLLLNIHSNPMNRFDYVDLDPYGSPSTFTDSAIRATKDGGIIALTATDLAPLCGVNPAACLRKYGGKPLRGGYSHEVALRLLIGSIIRQAAIHECAAIPVFSYYADHYVRAYMRLVYGARITDSIIAQMGYILHCEKCLHRITSKGSYPKAERKCPECGTIMKVAGPLWLGETSDLIYCGNLLENAYKKDVQWEPRLINLITMIRDEIGYPPYFFQVDEISSRLKLSSQNLETLIIKLRKEGFKAVRTHFNPRGIKTDAPVTQLANVLKA